MLLIVIVDFAVFHTFIVEILFRKVGGQRKAQSFGRRTRIVAYDFVSRDAYALSEHIKHGAAGIAAVNCGIGLNNISRFFQIFRVLIRYRTRRNRYAQTVRVTDDYRALSEINSVRIRHFYRFQRLLRNFFKFNHR